MTAITPVDRIAELLDSAGYQRLEMPLRISGLSFAFPMAFAGTASSPDLIVVADTAFESEQRILKSVEGVARALDVVRSKRPLTAVIAGPRPTTTVLDALSRVCRVLPVGTVLEGDPDVALRNWLSVLMPLHLPTPSSELADPVGEVARQIGGLDPAIGDLLALASQGSDAVQTRLHEIIDASLGDAGLAETT